MLKTKQKENPSTNFEIPQTGFVRLPQILTILPIGRSTWWAGVKSGKFPRCYHISSRCTAWKAQDIHKLIDQLSEVKYK